MRLVSISLFALVVSTSFGQLEFSINGQVVDQSLVQQIDLYNQDPVDIYMRNTSAVTVFWLFGQCRLNDAIEMEQDAILWESESGFGAIGIDAATLSYPCWDLLANSVAIEVQPNERAKLSLSFELFGAGCEVYRFKVIENGMYLDSIDVNFCATLGLEESILDEILFWPNPASNEITFPKRIRHVQILDISGAIVQEQTLKPDQSNCIISELSAGVYIINFEDEMGRFHTQQLFVRP